MCGIFGVFGHPEAANLTYLGLHALQHRGQESAGITVSDGDRLRTERRMGLVGEAFDRALLRSLRGPYAVGHVRYSTAGDSSLPNAQPFCVEYAHGAVAVAHNGNLINAVDLRKRLELDGAIFQSTSDSEVILHLLARARELELPGRIASALKQVEGAYSLLFLSENQMVAARDPRGFRPLCIGRIKGAFVFSSESVAFDLIGAEFIREVEPGELVVVDGKGLHSLHPWTVPEERRFCVFEHVYFARPDSFMDGRSVYAVREALGRRLAREHPVPADIVIPVPDSGVPAAIGYARESGVPFAMGLVRSHYVGRTFIEPEESIRHFGVKLKLNAVRQVLDGKRVIVVDDSLVRGTTARKIVKMLRAAGAREVHMRISSPPTTHPCFYGIDTPTRSELIASSHTPDEIARYVTCNTLKYLSREGMMEAVDEVTPDPGPKRLRVIGQGYCDACFTGRYPVEFAPGEMSSLRRVIN
ncbi:MAG: amidophosphoribosyltransferase [Myxococcales bacterium]|nr:amidophosphoribosyltransferase [Myxococcota bacterium]MDW8284229.1 amidophosphoribosyltransferase [Myxococcales bacterium]